MSSWLPSRARWSLGPGVRRENEGEESEGLGTAVVPLPRNGPQGSQGSAGTMLGFIPDSFPPRKRGPRSHGGAVATERASSQWVFRRHDAWVLMKERPLRGGGALGVWMSSWWHSEPRG